MRTNVKDMCFTALMAVMIAVCSWISIPIGTIPITLQTFGVAAALCILGGKRGTLSVIVYILLGAVGVPVFHGFKGGAGVLFGMTGGYILGFVMMGLCFMLLTKLLSDTVPVRIIALAAGLILCYAFGTVWFMVVYSQVKGEITAISALSMCVFPFIIPDIIKIAAAVLLSLRLAPVMNRMLAPAAK